ncbi:MAG: acetate uptake transporter [Pseudomonadota bacterium]|jgi:succinate-acetate transporter protein|nr:acetate uptake transporter [Xanthomonadaceae bacterium]MDE2247952.1 acetate uptake transporter [Xanthomonadaceae bacterium]MDE3210734.1 acetate uptake transporter [Pseudomonadota bacterium]
MSSEKAPAIFSNPAPLGLAGFALTTWLLSMINAGWFTGDAMNMVLAVALAYGGTAQIIAGVMELPRGNTFGSTAFISYGAFWWSFSLFVLFLHDKVPAGFVGWYLFLWGVFTFYMWIATFKAAFVLRLVFLVLWITFFLLAAGEWTGMSALHVAGGYGGLITAALAFYLSAAEVINDTHQRTVLPIGAPRAG